MRLCPKCKSRVNNPKSSFCFNCGARLFKEVTGSVKKTPVSRATDVITAIDLKPEVLDRSSSYDMQDTKSKKWNSFVLGANALTVLFLLFSIGVFFRTNYGKSYSLFSPTVSIDSIEVPKEKLPITLKEEVLKSKFFEIVPEDVILYSEGSNLGWFLESLLSEKQKKYLEDTYELKFEDLLIFMRPDYAFVRRNKNSWAVITKTGGIDFFDRTYAKYQENKVSGASIVTSRVGEFLVISVDIDLIQQMSDVNSRISLGIKNNSNFSKSLGKVKGFPVFFAYSPSLDYLSNDFEKDLKYFGIKNLIEYVGKIEGSGMYIAKEINGYSIMLLN